MTHRKSIAWTLGLGLALINGCAKSQTENKNAAKERWNGARAGILYSLAEQQYESGDLDKAEKSIVQAMKTAPDKSEHFELAARVEMARGRLERAYQLLEQAVALDEKRATAHDLMGVVLERWQRYDAAMEAYQRAYESRPDDVASLLSMAQMLVKLGRLDEAVSTLESKLTYFENSAAIRVELGQLYILKRDHAAATRVLRAASVLDPQDLAILEYLAPAQAASGDAQGAIQSLTKLMGDPRYADRDDLRMVLGDAYMAHRRPVEARAQFLRIVNRDGANVSAWIKLGQVALMVDDNLRLDQAIDRTLALAPDRPEGRLLKGMALQKRGSHAEAIAEFDAASRLAPHSAEPLLLKGISLERAGDHENAVQTYRKALELRPNDDRALQLLARAHKE